MRLHLMELEDQPWLPSTIRDAGTAYLAFAAKIAKQGEAVAPILAKALRKSGEKQIVDLCSGGTGPLPAAISHLRAKDGLEVSATFTDLYPNREAFERITADDPRLSAVYESVDATDVPDKLEGLRTLFSGFHHFRPVDAKRILEDAARSGRPIAVIELIARHPVAIVGILFAPQMTLFALPFLRPFRWSWIPLTYLIPAIPCMIGWDGFVSCLRCYTVDELREMTEAIDVDGYEWEVGPLEVASQPFDGTYLIGTPTTQSVRTR